MSKIDADWWFVRRKILGAAGASQVMASTTPPVYHHRVPYLRAKPRSCNPSTTRQQQQRARWAYITLAWQRLLDQNERDTWNFFALSILGSWRDEEQQYRKLNGFQWWCTLNGRLLRAGMPLCLDGYSWPKGQPLNTLDFAFLDDHTIRVTYDPVWGYDAGLVLYGRGPMSPGRHAVVPECTWARDSVPSRWYFIGFTGELASSPWDFTLPHPVPVGRKLAIMGCVMNLGGRVADDWLVEQYVRT